MKAVGLTPNIISYSATINACSKSGNVQLALQLMLEMNAAKLVPNVQCYSTLINVCS